MILLGHTMVTPRSVLFILWLPSEPERKWPSDLGVAIVDVGHQASGRAARAATPGGAASCGSGSSPTPGDGLARTLFRILWR